MAHLSGSTSTSSVLHQHRPLARILFLFSGLLAFAVSPVGADETVSDDDGSSDHVDPHTEDDGPLSPDDDDDDPPTSRPSSDRRRTDDEAIDDYIKAHNRLPTDEPSRPSSRSSREHSSDDSSSDDGDYDYGGDAEAAAQGRSYGDFADPGVTTLPSQSILGDWFDIGHNRDEGYGFRPDVRRFLQDAELAKRTRLQRLVIRGFDSDEEGKLDSAFAVFFGQYSGENDYDEHGDCLKGACRRFVEWAERNRTDRAPAGLGKCGAGGKEGRGLCRCATVVQLVGRFFVVFSFCCLSVVFTSAMSAHNTVVSPTLPNLVFDFFSHPSCSSWREFEIRAALRRAHLRRR